MATNLPNLSTDLYDVATLVAALQRKFTDIPDETISLGMYGYLQEMHQSRIVALVGKIFSFQKPSQESTMHSFTATFLYRIKEGLACVIVHKLHILLIGIEIQQKLFDEFYVVFHHGLFEIMPTSFEAIRLSLGCIACKIRFSFIFHPMILYHRVGMGCQWFMTDICLPNRMRLNRLYYKWNLTS